MQNIENPVELMRFLRKTEKNISTGILETFKKIEEDFKFGKEISNYLIHTLLEEIKKFLNSGVLISMDLRSILTDFLEEQQPNMEFPKNPMDLMRSIRKSEKNVPTEIMETFKKIEEYLNFGKEISVEIIRKLLDEIRKWLDSGVKILVEIRRIVEDFLSDHTHFLRHGAKGAAIGEMKNALRYAIKIGGRRSNVVSVFDKTMRSARGNPKWFARVDMPHKNVPFHHINVNKAVTGVKDPHIKISAGAAKAAGVAGQVLNVINKAAPVMMVASLACDAYEVGKSVIKDVENKSSRNTITTAVTTAATIGGGMAAAGTGAAIGTAIFPGIGTMIGGLIGAVVGSTGAGTGSEIVSEVVLDGVNYDIYDVVCKKCEQSFKNHRYKDGPQELCHKCGSWKQSCTETYFSREKKHAPASYEAFHIYQPGPLGFFLLY